MQVAPASSDSLRVSWAPAPGATHYMLLYSALSNGEPDDAKEVGGGGIYEMKNVDRKSTRLNSSHL